MRFELTLSSSSGLCLLPVGLQRHELLKQSFLCRLSFLTVLMTYPERLVRSKPATSTWNDSYPFRWDLNKSATTHPKELSILFDASRHVRSPFQVGVTDQQNHQSMSLHLQEHLNQDRFQHQQQTNVGIHKQSKPARRE